LRVVSGKYRGKKIVFPKKFPSRPTTDFAKEALFNILQNKLDWESTSVLDLFAGTGNISAEFLSRGAESVLSVEKHPGVVKHLRKVQEEFEDENWTIQRNEAFNFIETSKNKFDVIFADPPFGMKDLDRFVDKLLEGDHLKEDGMFILEHGKENDFSKHPRLDNTRNYGGVNFSFFC
jgi:16S rRNA (guanine966-N2)-methyltransferase